MAPAFLQSVAPKYGVIEMVRAVEIDVQVRDDVENDQATIKRILVSFSLLPKSVEQATGCQHLEPIIHDIQKSVDAPTCQNIEHASKEEKGLFVDAVARRNVARSVQQILQESQTISNLVREGKLAVVGALYDIASGKIDIPNGETPSLTLVGSNHAGSRE